MARSLHGRLAAMLREAHAASTESAATGVPIDEVSAMRAERAIEARAATVDRRLSRRSLLKAGAVASVGAAAVGLPACGRRSSRGPAADRDRRWWRGGSALRPPPLEEVEQALDDL